jgi:hypothetical protein
MSAPSPGASSNSDFSLLEKIEIGEAKKIKEERYWYVLAPCCHSLQASD